MTDLGVVVILLLAFRGTLSLRGDARRARQWFRDWRRWTA